MAPAALAHRPCAVRGCRRNASAADRTMCRECEARILQEAFATCDAVVARRLAVYASPRDGTPQEEVIGEPLF